MISKEANQLISKLQRLKTPESKENKSIKTIAHNVIEYEAKVKKWLVKFDVQMTDLDSEIKTLRSNEKREEQKAIKEIDNYELSLKNLLNSYHREASKAKQKLSVMVISIKEEMNISLKTNIKIEKQSLSKYKNLSQKLQKMIQAVRQKQKRSIDDFQGVKDVIRGKANEVSQANQRNIQQVSIRTKRLNAGLEQLSNKIDDNLLRFVKKFDGKVFQTNKIINTMVQYATNE